MRETKKKAYHSGHLPRRIECAGPVRRGGSPAPAIMDPRSLSETAPRTQSKQHQYKVVETLPSFFVIQGRDRGTRFELEKSTLSIGRDVRSDIRLQDTEVSRRHAELRKTESGFTIQDMGSSNGTFVNGTAVSTHEMQSGDQLLLGRSLLLYTGGGASAASRLGAGPGGEPGRGVGAAAAPQPVGGEDPAGGAPPPHPAQAPHPRRGPQQQAGPHHRALLRGYCRLPRCQRG